MKRSKKQICTRVLALTLAMFPCAAYAAESFGTVGYHCYKNNPSSGIVIIGDSNTCQLWGYQHSSASYCSTWGGHYGYGAGMGLQINSSSYVAQMKTLIRNTLKKKGKCTVFVCGTNNDDNDSYAAYNCMSLVKTLNYKSSYIKYTHVADCLAGSRGGFLSNDSHYNNATLKKIITKFKKLS